MIVELAQAFAMVFLFLCLTSVSLPESRPNAEKSCQRIDIQFDYEAAKIPLRFGFQMDWKSVICLQSQKR